MLIDKIVLSADKTWCRVYLADGRTFKYDFTAMKVTYQEGLELVNLLHSEDFDLAA